MPGGIATPSLVQHKDIYVAEARIKLSSQDRQRIADNDEHLIKELILQGFTKEQFDDVLDPKMPVERKRAIASTVANSISAVEGEAIVCISYDKRPRRGCRLDFAETECR